MIICEETLFGLSVYKQFSVKIVYIVAFSTPIAIFLNLITSAFKKKIVNGVITYTLVIILGLFFATNFIYYEVYNSILSIYSIGNGGQVFQFYETILEVIYKNWLVIGLFLLPIVILIILNIFKIIRFDKTNLKKVSIQMTLIIVIQVTTVLSINIFSDESVYSDREIYNDSTSLVMIAQRFGLLTANRLEIEELLINDEETVDVVNMLELEPQDTVQEIEYNVVDIDFETLIQNEKNQKIKNIHTYMSAQIPSNKNDYTGMFEGKNLIVFVAESLSNIAVREDVTPTLYKLYSEGFQFDNFYTPIFPVSTADGEYIADTSLIPKEGVWSLPRVENNYMPYSYANAFEKLGYSSNAYHNHTATYYNRDKYMKGMGYDSYLAAGNGLEDRMVVKRWPSSDLDMINVTVDDYINNEKFVAYYMTISGHLGYTETGNVMSDKNYSLVKDLPYSYRAKCYLAAQIELDKAVESLINKLTEAGKLEDTVIVISGDHYPYGLELDEINELSEYERDSVFNIYDMPFLIWNSEMEEPVKVSKIGSSLDILPTVLNLFGVEHDSRLLMGSDILSLSESLVILSDRSFITAKGRYNSITGTFEKSVEEDFDETAYIDRISKIIQSKYQISRLILENDYYRYLKDYI
jgi:phosphoglycerol transferase MdoB-like AlkP superfamily enzyme